MCLLEKKTFSAGIQVPYSDFLFYGSPPFRHVNVRKTGLTPCSGRQAGLHCRVAYRTIYLPLCIGCFRLSLVGCAGLGAAFLCGLPCASLWRAGALVR